MNKLCSIPFHINSNQLFLMRIDKNTELLEMQKVARLVQMEVKKCCSLIFKINQGKID